MYINDSTVARIYINYVYNSKGQILLPLYGEIDMQIEWLLEDGEFQTAKTWPLEDSDFVLEKIQIPQRPLDGEFDIQIHTLLLYREVIKIQI